MLVVYSESGDRVKEIAETQARVSFWRQIKSSLWHVAGPMNIIGGLVLSVFLSWWAPHTEQVPHWAAFLTQFILLALVADFGLYWGHRIQHENEWLWKNCHSVHHRLRTPTAFSAAYIEDRDAALQSLFPLLLSAVVVR
jgi:sterol desaturase/sphingolipid hydroxylase (fatty acid hydroxylase superfamily)